MSEPEFNWHDNPDIVVRPAEAIAVYTNRHGDVVLRKQADWPDEQEDVILIVPRDRAWDFAQAVLIAADLLAEEDEGSGTPAGIPPGLPAPRSSNAERQRRWRDKHRQARNGNVTRNAAALPDDLLQHQHEEGELAHAR